MANEATVKFLGAFQRMRKPLQFLTSWFKTDKDSYFNTESVRIHVRRHGEPVAVAVQGITSSPRWTDLNQFSKKTFTPYAFNEGYAINGADVFDMQFGHTEYDESNYVSLALKSFAEQGVEKERSILRAIELMSSQILQTGTVTLINSAGSTIGAMDFKPKATHFPQVSVSWATVATATPLDDLEDLADVIRADTGLFPSVVIMGAGAYRNAIQTTSFLNALDNRRIETALIMPESINSSGAKKMGYVDVGAYRLEIWTYPATYDHIQTAVKTPYIADDLVVMLSPDTELKMLYGGFPSPLIGPDPRLAAFTRTMPSRISRAGFVDVNPLIWADETGQVIKGALRSRPLPIPVGIDEFGCLNTVQP